VGAGHGDYGEIEAEVVEEVIKPAAEAGGGNVNGTGAVDVCKSLQVGVV
jgi:hypothetical protein